MRLVLIFILFLGISSAHATTAGEYLDAGNDAYKNHEYDQAIFDYTKALDINANLPNAYNNRGVAYAQEGSLVRAIADFTMAIANNLNDAEAYNNRGHAYAEKNNLSQAIVDYTQAIQINPLYFKAYTNRERAYYDLKDYDQAWSDVFTVEELGGKVDSDFYQALKQASGKS